LVAALLCYGFFPQSFVRMVAPSFQTYLTATSSHATDQTCSHGAVPPCFTEQHHQNASTQRGGYNIEQIANR
jgi:hypothetical protein